MADIFSPVQLGDIKLANRIVMAPMTRDRAGDGDVPTSIMAEYYAQRASAGLIITEGTQPSKVGKGYWRTPGIHSQTQIDGWRVVTDAVHAKGGKIVMQIMHVGRAAVQANKGEGIDTIAPSAIPCPDKIPGPDGVPQDAVMPREIKTDEIPALIEDYAQAARNAIAAGMDGVELHCASGYLPMQFLSSNSNQRTDDYGGNVENRIRFVVETLAAMSDTIGAGRVGFRICPGVRFNGMHDADPVETYTELFKAVDGLGLSYVHLIHIPLKGGDALDLVNAHWSGSIITNQGLKLDTAKEVLTSGKANAVAFGYNYIGNPDLVERFKHSHPLAKANRDTFYTGNGDDRVGYTDYPRF